MSPGLEAGMGGNGRLNRRECAGGGARAATARVENAGSGSRKAVEGTVLAVARMLRLLNDAVIPAVQAPPLCAGGGHRQPENER